MLGLPAAIVIGLVWIPTVFTVILSFARWDGIGGTSTIEWIGPQNYVDAVQAYPPFQQALHNNVLWLAFLFVFPTILGIFLAVLLDRGLKGSRLYQSIFYIPVVLSMALVGFVWQLIYSTDGGVLNTILVRTSTGSATPTSTSGPSWSPRAGGTPATSCCCTWRVSKPSTRRCAKRPSWTAPARSARSSGSCSP